MNGYEVFCTYQSVKLHFTTDSYCFFKYNGKVSTTPEGFEKRKDKYTFHRLARELKDDDVLPFFVSNFLLKNKIWSKELLSEEAKTIFKNWQIMRANLDCTFEEDIGKIITKLNSENLDIRHMFALDYRKNQYPLIWQMMNHGEISLETVTILHGLTGVLDLWDKTWGKDSPNPDYIFEKTSRLIRKYEPFLHLDVSVFKEIVRKHLIHVSNLQTVMS